MLLDHLHKCSATPYKELCVKLISHKLYMGKYVATLSFNGVMSGIRPLIITLCNRPKYSFYRFVLYVTGLSLLNLRWPKCTKCSRASSKATLFWLAHVRVCGRWLAYVCDSTVQRQWNPATMLGIRWRKWAISRGRNRIKRTCCR